MKQVYRLRGPNPGRGQTGKTPGGNNNTGGGAKKPEPEGKKPDKQLEGNEPSLDTGTPDGSIPTTTTYAPDAIRKFRQTARRIRGLAKKHGFDIPQKMKQPATQKAIKDYVDFILENGKTGVGAYKPTGGGDLNALWTQYGDTIVLRRSNGEFITFLDASGGGQALNSPFSKP